MSGYKFPSIAASDVVEYHDTLTLIDARKAVARTQSGLRLAHATWVDPLSLSRAVLDPLTGKDVAIFCAHGQELSHYVTAFALMNGINARLVTGGFDALVDAGAMTENLESGKDD